jgi:tetratricopeptide (TPR) repeat protein
MRCPGCGLYHPPQYENCVSCGASLGTVSHAEQYPENDAASMATMTEDKPDNHTGANTFSEPSSAGNRRSKKTLHHHYSGLPTSVGIAAIIAIVLISGGATFFFLTRATDDQLLLNQGLREISGGQYAFAVKSLEKAAAMRPKDAKIYLALARAYIGVDQIDKAWEAIGQAQQLGTGIVADPTLASELANYYRQRREYERAIELLRPLADANIQGKKAELADLDALCGDEALRDGKYELALKCWEEARDLKEGVRYTEAEARLATIYQKMSDKLLLSGNDEQALTVLNKLNSLSENGTNLEKTADIYERQNKLDLAIDHYRRASRLSASNSALTAKLAAVLSRYGKQLLDQGDTSGGYGYLQQAQALDPKIAVPSLTLRNTSVSFEGYSHLPKISGEIWNPSTEAINDLTIKVELIDTKSAQVLWQQTQKVVDEFVAPLLPQATKAFESTANIAVKDNGKTSFRISLNGQVYKTYMIGSPQAPSAEKSQAESISPSAPADTQKMPQTAPRAVQSEPAPQPAPARKPATLEQTPDEQSSPEDQTLKDLER